jgi:hypothetical protein
MAYVTNSRKQVPANTGQNVNIHTNKFLVEVVEEVDTEEEAEVELSNNRNFSQINP